MKIILTKFGIDLTIWIFATPFAYLLRVEDAWSTHTEAVFWVTLMVLPFKTAILLYEKFFLQVWNMVGLRDLFAINKGVLVYAVFFLGMAYLFRSEIFIPYSVPFIEAMLLVIGMGGVRLSSRLWHEYKHRRDPDFKKNRKRVLIAGAGEAGTMIAREMMRYPETNMTPIGFLDDDRKKQKQSFLGLNVLGSTDEVAKLIRKYNIDTLLIAMPSESGDVVRKIIEEARDCDVEYKIIPAIHEILSGDVTINKIRDVDVEDLLRREPVKLNTTEIVNYLNNRNILVTGAGGSIGSEIVRQLTHFDPHKIILVDHSEHNIYMLEQELAESFNHIPVETIISDIRDINSLQSIFKKYSPDVIFHAAAHKHVPLMEVNPEQAILNNVAATKNLVNLALDFDTNHFVNISTDKAVNPTSVMGASKRIAEFVVEDGSRKAKSSQIFVSVRFGNVLGSRGSVLPKFKRQIAARRTVTITHPEMRRYFMTTEEASQLVLQAGGLKKNGAVYILDMGEPIKIIDLAKDLIRLSGLEPNVDIPIKITGVRPGEKLFEELLTFEENIRSTKFNKIHVARQNGLPANFDKKLDELIELAIKSDEKYLRKSLSDLIKVNALSSSEFEEFI